MKKHSICTACEIAHIENCGTCFGFGVYLNDQGETSPVRAGDAHEKKFSGPVHPCPECGSTENGIPATVEATV